LALHGYHSAQKKLPGGAAYVGDDRRIWLPGGNWLVLILPFMEEQGVYDGIDHKKPLADPANSLAVQKTIATIICPTDPLASSPILTNRQFGSNHPCPPTQMGLWYAASVGPTHDGITMTDGCPFCESRTPGPSNYCCQGFNYGTSGSPNRAIPPQTFAGLFGRCPKGVKFAQVKDGLSHTIMVGEVLPGECAFQSAFSQNFPIASHVVPMNTFQSATPFGGTYLRACGFKSKHPGGAHFAMGDGSVHFVTETIEYRLYCNLGTRAGGEVVQLP
jgi:prepilin-type processing-associated H-X9-DG protein